VISKIGIFTSIDPAKEGGRLNELAERNDTCRIRRLDVDSEEYLIYKAPKPNAALIRATRSDAPGKRAPKLAERLLLD